MSSGRGSGKKRFSIDSAVVPPEFYCEDYKIDEAMVRMTNQEEISILSA